MLLDGLAKRAEHDLASVTAAMNAAATQDLRQRRADAGAAVAADAPPPRRARGRRACSSCWWRGARPGSSRLDRDLDGVIDAGPGPAIWDAFYPRLYDGGDARDCPASTPSRAPTRGPDSGFTNGGFWYLDKDLRRLNGERFKAPFKRRYCGDGNRAACARAVWAALEAVPGDPDAMRADATRERISFRPGLLPTTIRYTNRPSGIQQVIRSTGTGLGEAGAGCELREDLRHDAEDADSVALVVAAAVLAHGAVDDHVLAAALEVEEERVRAADAHRRRGLVRRDARRRRRRCRPGARVDGRAGRLMNVITEIGSSLPAARVLVVARGGQRAEAADRGHRLRRAGGVVVDLRTRRRERAATSATSATNLPGSRPLSVPDRLVATSLPAADDSDAPL